MEGIIWRRKSLNSFETNQSSSTLGINIVNPNLKLSLIFQISSKSSAALSSLIPEVIFSILNVIDSGSKQVREGTYH